MKSSFELLMEFYAIVMGGVYVGFALMFWCFPSWRMFFVCVVAFGLYKASAKLAWQAGAVSGKR